MGEYIAEEYYIATEHYVADACYLKQTCKALSRPDEEKERRRERMGERAYMHALNVSLILVSRC